MIEPATRGFRAVPIVGVRHLLLSRRPRPTCLRRTASCGWRWPTRRETMMTALMVIIMTTLLAIFFFGVDTAFSSIVQALLSLLS